MDAYADFVAVVSPVLSDIIGVAKQSIKEGVAEIKCPQDDARDWQQLLDMVHIVKRAEAPSDWVCP